MKPLRHFLVLSRRRDAADMCTSYYDWLLRARRFRRLFPERVGDGVEDKILRGLALLRALGDAPTVAAVEGALGKGKVSTFWCTHCDKRVERVVLMGEVPDHESATVHLCEDCLRKALEAIVRERKNSYRHKE